MKLGAGRGLSLAHRAVSASRSRAHASPRRVRRPCDPAPPAARAHTRSKLRILFVCTGNLCRSPVAERLAVAWARDLLRESPELATRPDRQRRHGCSPGPADGCAQRRGVDGLSAGPCRLPSRLFERAMAEEPTWCLTMSRHQRRRCSSRIQGLRRTFTLLEAADLLEGTADLTGLASLPLAQRARGARACASMPRAGFARRDDTDDVLDPIGRSAAVHRRWHTTIATALRPLADVLLHKRPATCRPFLSRTTTAVRSTGPPRTRLSVGPEPRSTAPTVFQRIMKSNVSDQFST